MCGPGEGLGQGTLPRMRPAHVHFGLLWLSRAHYAMTVTVNNPLGALSTHSVQLPGCSGWRGSSAAATALHLS